MAANVWRVTAACPLRNRRSGRARGLRGRSGRQETDDEPTGWLLKIGRHEDEEKTGFFNVR